MVESDEEQSRLESLIDGVKPPVPGYPDGLHYLLWTPFRYRAARNGSRFGRKGDIPVWYGARDEETCLYEWAAHRFVFLDDTAASLGRQDIPLTGFQAPINTASGIDLCLPPFDSYRDELCDRSSYEESQRLGNDMRQAAVQAFRYFSARDPLNAPCLGIFDPLAFSELEPRANSYRNWFAQVENDRVLFFKRQSDPTTLKSKEISRKLVM